MSALDDQARAKILQISTAEEPDSISPALVSDAMDLLRQIGSANEQGLSQATAAIDGAVQSIGAKQGVLEAELGQLGPKCDQNTSNIANLQQEIDEIEPIVINGDVTNAPDEEDVTTDSNNLLKLKDRPTAVNQKGYKILRKDTSLASQMTDTNTIYEVRYAFDLNGGTLVLPQGSELIFNGGSISNCTVNGNNTRVINAKMTNVVLQGAFIGEFNDKEVELSATLSTNPLVPLFACGFEKITLERNYSIPTLPNIVVSNGTKEIIINGQISRNEPSNKDTNNLLYLIEVKDCYIHGEGSIIGSKDYSGTNTGEWQHGIYLKNCSNVKIEGISVNSFWGDGICLGEYNSQSLEPEDWAKSSKNIVLSNLKISNIGRNGIAVTMGENVRISNCYFKDITNAPGAAIDLEPNVGAEESEGETIYLKKYVQDIAIDNIYVENCRKVLQLYASYSGFVNNVSATNITTRNMVGNSFFLYMCRNVKINNINILGGENEIGSVFLMSAYWGVSISNVFCNEQNADVIFSLCGNSKGNNGVALQLSNIYVTGCKKFIRFGSDRYAVSSTNVVLKDSIVKTSDNVVNQNSNTSGSAPNRFSIENCRFINIGNDTSIFALRFYNADKINITNCSFEEYGRAVGAYGTSNLYFSNNFISRTNGTGVMFSCSTDCDNFVLKDNRFSPSVVLDYLVDMGGIPCQLTDNVGDYALNFYRVQSSYTNNPKYENANSRYGSTGKRPVLPRQDNTIYCNTSINKMQMCITGKWFNADGTPDGTNIKYI